MAGALCIAAPALASSRRHMASMTEGPFYPPRAWREQWPDWDADMSRVRQRDGSMLSARGELLGLEGQVVDTAGRLIDAAEVEVWQCDAMAQHLLVVPA
jgi:protocatechuate 3,4-dioxygenase beta subunit